MPERSDGSAPDDSLLDAATNAPDAAVNPREAGSALPPQATQLTGQYARRSTFFEVGGTSSDPLFARGVELALLSFRADGQGGLELHTELCDIRVENEYGVAIRIATLATEPSSVQPVNFDADGSFHTEIATIVVGYDAARFSAPGCETPGAGARRACFADQTWSVDATEFRDADNWNNAHTCACAPLADNPPSSPTDCRLTNPDGDATPGITAYSSTSIAPIEIAWSMTFEVGSALDDGTIDAAGRVAASERRTLRVSCVNREVDGCMVSKGTPCVASTGQTLIHRINTPSSPSVTSCDDLRKAPSVVFPQGVPDYPREVCIDAP